MEFLNGIQLVETSSISIPPPGYINLFVSTSGLLFIKDSNNVITQLSNIWVKYLMNYSL